MSRRSILSAQLAQLQETPASYDPDASDNLDGHSRFDSRRAGGADDQPEDGARVAREHYLDVGPSRLRSRIGDGAAQTLLGSKYGGEVRGRNKIFDDDDDDDEEDDEDDGLGGEEGSEDDEEDDEDEEAGMDERESEAFDEGESGGSEDDEEDDDDDEDDEDDGEEDRGDGDDEDDDAEHDQPGPRTASKGNSIHQPEQSSRTLDPIAALRDSRQKDIIKGRAIKQQRALFESLLTVRITYQKALTALCKLPAEYPTSPSAPTVEGEAPETAQARREALEGLMTLNERIFALRERVRLPDTTLPTQLGKRKRGAGSGAGGEDEGYWIGSAEDAMALSTMNRHAMMPILTKWASRIQAASLNVGSGGKTAGSSKFLQSTKGSAAEGIIEAIEAGLASRAKSAPSTLLEGEEPHYRALLREIIDTRSAGTASASASASHTDAFRREKKKQREADRGGSKGRKIRYTVHDKAQNFVVAQPLRSVYLTGGGGGEAAPWSDEQMDELFGSLLGGVGMSGGRSEGGVGMGLGVGLGVAGGTGLLNAVGDGEEGIASLGGLRVF